MVKVTYELGGILLADLFAVLMQPICQPGAACGRALRREQVAHEALIFLPCENGVSDEQPGDSRRDIRERSREVKHTGRAV